MNVPIPISITILTKNSSQFITKVLLALTHFDEVVIYDTGSSDETLDLAKQFPNVTIFQGKLQGFGPTHNQASECARNDWILSIDSDEIVSPELLNELKLLQLNPLSVYSLPRKNYYKKKWIRWCGWHPDRQIRLYNRTKTTFDSALVHESILSEGFEKIPLQGWLDHYSYTDTSDFLAKMQNYSTLFAEQNAGKRKSSLKKAIFHGLFAFFKSFFLKRGFMGGTQGFEISFYNANTAFYKYLKLHEANLKLRERKKTESIA